ncbi:hypothetical protein DPX16_3084 [Anabarilius grahami]|uniref:Uncharacterized protein n=1 Tax=Anabarilius grahami TaxID=495550 RepID=A0A3N0XJ26_ANAGA|nr:hypothetical protein DPX16_3084 [Anabarilius grahami]
MQEASGDGNQASCGVSQTPSQQNVRSSIRSGSSAGLQFVAVRDVPFGIAPEMSVWVQTSARLSITQKYGTTSEKYGERKSGISGIELLDVIKASTEVVAVAEQPIRMIRWPDGLTPIQHVELAEKKADKDQLQPTVWDTLRKLSRPTNKKCPTADSRLACGLAGQVHANDSSPAYKRGSRERNYQDHWK